MLWSAIRPENCQVHSVCADLFLRLHNISPNALLCEDVVSNTMVAQSSVINSAIYLFICIFVSKHHQLLLFGTFIDY